MVDVRVLTQPRRAFAFFPNFLSHSIRLNRHSGHPKTDAARERLATRYGGGGSGPRSSASSRNSVRPNRIDRMRRAGMICFALSACCVQFDSLISYARAHVLLPVPWLQDDDFYEMQENRSTTSGFSMLSSSDRSLPSMIPPPRAQNAAPNRSQMMSF
jgi:hypothetical protein